METVLKLSEAATLGLHALSYLKNKKSGLASAKEMAKQFKVSVNHLAKVCRRLVQAGLASSVRGPLGGIRLAKPPNEVLLMQIYEAIDGPLPLNTCFLGKKSCTFGNCMFGNMVSKIKQLVADYFSHTSLADLDYCEFKT